MERPAKDNHAFKCTAENFSPAEVSAILQQEFTASYLRVQVSSQCKNYSQFSAGWFLFLKKQQYSNFIQKFRYWKTSEFSWQIELQLFNVFLWLFTGLWEQGTDFLLANASFAITGVTSLAQLCYYSCLPQTPGQTKLREKTLFTNQNLQAYVEESH